MTNVTYTNVLTSSEERALDIWAAAAVIRSMGHIRSANKLADDDDANSVGVLLRAASELMIRAGYLHHLGWRALSDLGRDQSRIERFLVADHELPNVAKEAVEATIDKLQRAEAMLRFRDTGEVVDPAGVRLTGRTLDAIAKDVDRARLAAGHEPVAAAIYAGLYRALSTYEQHSFGQLERYVTSDDTQFRLAPAPQSWLTGLGIVDDMIVTSIVYLLSVASPIWHALGRSIDVDALAMRAASVLQSTSSERLGLLRSVVDNPEIDAWIDQLPGLGRLDERPSS